MLRHLVLERLAFIVIFSSCLARFCYFHILCLFIFNLRPIVLQSNFIRLLLTTHQFTKQLVKLLFFLSIGYFFILLKIQPLILSIEFDMVQIPLILLRSLQAPLSLQILAQLHLLHHHGHLLFRVGNSLMPPHRGYRFGDLVDEGIVWVRQLVVDWVQFCRVSMRLAWLCSVRM